MLVPGSNLLQLALGVIGQQAVEWRRYAGQETTPSGIVRARWSGPVTIYGSLQPADSRLLQQLGLDWTKNYIVFRGSANFSEPDRDQTGDKLTYGGKTYQIVGRTDWYLQDGWQAVVAIELMGERRQVRYLRPRAVPSTGSVPVPRISGSDAPTRTLRPTAVASTGSVPAPILRAAPIALRPAPVVNVGAVPVPSVRPGAAILRPAPVTNAGAVPTPTLRPGAVTLRAAPVPAEGEVPAPALAPAPIALRPTAVASTGSVPVPRIVVPSAWYDAPQYDRMVAMQLGDQAAIWTGAMDGSRYVKRAAAPEELFAVTSPAGSSYIPAGGLPYATDTPANSVRFDSYRGRPQMATDPTPRFSRTFPNNPWTAPQTLELLQWDYVASFFAPVGEWVEFIGPSITGGRWELHGQGADVWVWTIIPHPSAGEVQIIPHGSNIRYFMVDTHGVSGLDPDYPTNWIPTVTERVDRAGDSIQPTVALRNMLVNAAGVRQGTIICQGQFYAPHHPERAGILPGRCAFGWNDGGNISVAADGTLYATGGWGPQISAAPGLPSDGGDPFRFCFSFRDRDLSEEFPGVRRIAINNGMATEQIGRYNGGPGDMHTMQIARTPGSFSAEDAGAGGYDFWGFSPDLMTVTEVETWAQHPGFVHGHSPAREDV